MSAPFASDPARARGRRWPEDESPFRSCFQRDRDRIIHASAFRRLKHKTQVFVEHEGDYFRTRLTHSIEVAQVARTIAGALNLIGSKTLFGRYWGCTEDHPFLHFELCYYQAIDFAITNGLATVEAGAQGAHKLARGYLPVTTHSLHWIGDPGFADAIARYLEAEKEAIDEEIEIMTDYGPFKKAHVEEQE